MSKTLQFKTFCFEMYKAEKGITGILTQELYDVLHTTGQRYIINDIDLYIEARANTNN